MNNEFQQQKVLIVDDTSSDIAILHDMLKPDCKLCFAKNGEDAMKIAKSEEPPHLILLDIILPGMDGYEVCRLLKTDPQTRDIPIIFITVKDHAQDEAKGLELGAVDYITKPFFLPIVKARVRTHLELKRHRDKLERLSSLDGLTGIPNRRRFDESFNQEWRNAIREGMPLSLIMIDIDYFKAYNDNYGHIAGDECLKLVALALVGSLKRPRDLVARYGGEEFFAILPCTDIGGAVHIAKIFQATIAFLAIPHNFSPVACHVTISIGTASIMPSHHCSSQCLKEAADQELYHAKKMGRNRIESVEIPSNLGLKI